MLIKEDGVEKPIKLKTPEQLSFERWLAYCQMFGLSDELIKEKV